MFRRLFYAHNMVCFLSVLGFSVMFCLFISFPRTFRFLLDYEAISIEKWILAAQIWFFSCIVAPFWSLKKLHKNRIHRADHAPSFLSLLKLHLAPRWWYGHDNSKLIDVIDNAECQEEGTEMEWSHIKTLTDKERINIQRIVEDFISIDRAGDGTLNFVERSAWLPILCSLNLNCLFLISALLAFDEVVKGNGPIYPSEILPIGKPLAEWVSNYVLLIFALGEIITRGSMFSAFQGHFSGPLATMTPMQRKSMVALYVAISEGRIEGLMQKGCYAPVRMTGRKWQAPQVNSALLAAVGKFDLFQLEDKWVISWNSASKDEFFTVRTVSRSVARSVARSRELHVGDAAVAKHGLSHLPRRTSL